MQIQAGAKQEGNKRGSRRLPGVASRQCCWRGRCYCRGGFSFYSSSLFFLFFSLSPLFFRSLLYFFLLFLVFFSLSIFPPSSALSLSIYPCLPCIYRQKTWEREVGAAIVLPPHDCPRRHVSSVSPTHGRPRVSLASGCFGWRPFELFRGRKVGENAREQKLPSPIFYTSKGRRRRTLSFKTRRFI